MLPRNGLCLLFIIIFIAVNYAARSVKNSDFDTDFYEEQGKVINLSQLQQMLRGSQPTQKPAKSRPSSNYPMSYPPYYYPYGPRPRPKPKPTKPSTGNGDCLQPTPQDPRVVKYCEDPDNVDVPLCQIYCKYFPDYTLCEPFCAITTNRESPICSSGCQLTDPPKSCKIPKTPPPKGCPHPEDDVPIEDCILWCVQYNDRAPWCTFSEHSHQYGYGGGYGYGNGYGYGYGNGYGYGYG